MIEYNIRRLEKAVTALEVTGELDNFTSGDFFACLESEIEKGSVRIVVDCSGLSHISSSGIASLIRAHARMKKHGGDVKLAGLQGPVSQVLHLTSLDRVFGIYPDVPSALAAFT